MPMIVFVGRNTVRPGGMGAMRAAAAGTAAMIEANHARHLLLRFYFDDDASVMTTVQVHPDEASFRRHLQLGAESGHFADAAHLITASEVTVYGDVSAGLAETVSRIARGGTVTIHRDPVGFDRL